MTDRNKFEQMLERLISEDQEAAKELFHQLVVEKSREIYENILAEDFNDEEGEDVGGDETDDFLNDVEEPGSDEHDDMSDEHGEGDEDLESRVMDVEDELESLRAEFDRLMAEEGEEDEHSDMHDDEDTEDDYDEDGEEGEGDEDEHKTEENFMREYIEKVTAPKGGDNGVNTKSIVAKKNNMGGTTANLRGGEAKGEGTKGGLLNPAAKEEDFGNINVPGGNAGKTAFKRKESPKAAAGKDSKAKSPISGLKSRAK